MNTQTTISRKDRATPRRRPTASVLAALAASMTLVLGASGTLVGATGTDPAPSGTRSATGANGQSITVTPVDGLPLSGGTVQVTGTGFSHDKGVYLALCVDNGPTAAPAPCVGGAPMAGGTGASYWISTNPPSYAIGLTKPLDDDGGFSLALSISSTGEGIDCLAEGTKCVVSTRADHTQPGERGWDTVVPVTFVGQDPLEGGGTIPTTTPPTTTPATTTPPTTAPATSTPQTTAPATTAPATGEAQVLASSANNQSTGTATPTGAAKASELAFTGSNSLTISIVAMAFVALGIALLRRSATLTAATTTEEG